MANVSLAVVNLSIGETQEKYKVLVTDLDNVLWAGLAAEDGPENIHCAPEGIGYRHFLYQSLLAKLRRVGSCLRLLVETIWISPLRLLHLEEHFLSPMISSRY